MLKNHFKIALRNLTKNRFFSLLNLTGLAVGMAVSLILMLFVKKELSFDQYHEKGKDIVRAGLNVSYEDTHEKWIATPNIAGPALLVIGEVSALSRAVRQQTSVEASSLRLA